MVPAGLICFTNPWSQRNWGWTSAQSRSKGQHLDSIGLVWSERELNIPKALTEEFWIEVNGQLSWYLVSFTSTNTTTINSNSRASGESPRKQNIRELSHLSWESRVFAGHASQDAGFRLPLGSWLLLQFQNYSRSPSKYLRSTALFTRSLTHAINVYWLLSCLFGNEGYIGAQMFVCNQNKHTAYGAHCLRGKIAIEK